MSEPWRRGRGVIRMDDLDRSAAHLAIDCRLGPSCFAALGLQPLAVGYRDDQAQGSLVEPTFSLHNLRVDRFTLDTAGPRGPLDWVASAWPYPDSSQVWVTWMFCWQTVSCQ